MKVFLDFEASSLSDGSYPVEVAWVFQDGRSESHLIKPAPAWTDWDEKAEAIHGISRETLAREGQAHDLVPARLSRTWERANTAGADWYGAVSYRGTVARAPRSVHALNIEKHT